MSLPPRPALTDAATLDRLLQLALQAEGTLAKTLWAGMAANERLDRLEQLLLNGRVTPPARPFSLRRALRAFVRRLLDGDAPPPPVSPFPPPRQEVF